MSLTAGRQIRQFIVKIASRCDLACDYCYIYRLGDHRWQERPRVMTVETIDRTARRIADHTRTHQISTVDLVLHGGEPLLAGPEILGHCIRKVRSEAGPNVRIRVVLQTNGVRLDHTFLELFHLLDVRVGISLDGGPTAHDRHRRDRRGTGSHHNVVRAVRALAEPRYRRLYAGLLCTVDLDNDPVQVYEDLISLDPPMIDLLLPHGTWSAPPPGRDPASADAPYGRWLVSVFERWYDAPHRATRIRLFEEIMRVLCGKPSRLEGIGSAPAASIVIETDGAIEESDHLAALSGTGLTGINVANGSFDEALAHRPAAVGLSQVCRACPVVRVCGGGLPSHRYRDGAGFDNPSIYSHDLRHLIEHIHHRFSADVQALRRAA